MIKILKKLGLKTSILIGLNNSYSINNNQEILSNLVNNNVFINNNYNLLNNNNNLLNNNIVNNGINNINRQIEINNRQNDNMLFMLNHNMEEFNMYFLNFLIEVFDNERAVRFLNFLERRFNITPIMFGRYLNFFVYGTMFTLIYFHFNNLRNENINLNSLK